MGVTGGVRRPAVSKPQVLAATTCQVIESAHTWSNLPMNTANRTCDLPTRLRLRRARGARCIGPLELSLRVGVSQRRVSVVESGRARPRRELFAGMRRNVIGAEAGACGWM